MLFACGVGVGLFFYGVAEPIYHYTSRNRYSADPTLPDNELAQIAINLPMYHWGMCNQGRIASYYNDWCLKYAWSLLTFSRRSWLGHFFSRWITFEFDELPWKTTLDNEILFLSFDWRCNFWMDWGFHWCIFNHCNFVWCMHKLRPGSTTGRKGAFSIKLKCWRREYTITGKASHYISDSIVRID